jgi:hypothetical protein
MKTVYWFLVCGFGFVLYESLSHQIGNRKSAIANRNLTIGRGEA